jgi:hypothetical protein
LDAGLFLGKVRRIVEVNVRLKIIVACPLVDIISIAQEVHIEVLKLWRHSELRVLRVELGVGQH